MHLKLQAPVTKAIEKSITTIEIRIDNLATGDLLYKQLFPVSSIKSVGMANRHSCIYFYQRLYNFFIG